jgi:hypothetical protein
MTAFKSHSTGDAVIDKLLTDYSNAVFDCGEWRDEGDDPCYDEDRKYAKYEDASAVVEKARDALYTTLAARLGMGKRADEVKP